MSIYKLYYFPATGTAQTARMMLSMSETPFDDIRLNSEDWMRMKPTMPFEHMPVLEVDGKMIAKDGAINRFVAQRFGFYGADEFQSAQTDMMAEAAIDLIAPLYRTYDELSENIKANIIRKYETEQMPTLMANIEKNLDESGYCIEKSLSLGDIALYNALEAIAVNFKVKLNLDAYPHLQALYNHVRRHPSIAKWIQLEKLN